MKLSLWDRLSLNVTGRLPKSTQAKVDAQLKKEQEELKARLEKLSSTAALKSKPATTKKPAAKKPEAKKPAAKKPATKKKGSK